MAKVTPEMKAEMNRLRHEEGWPYMKIARQYYLDPATVRYHTNEEHKASRIEYHNKTGAKSTKPKFSGHYPEETKQKARDLRAQGWSYRQIAKEIGCTAQTVRVWCDQEAAEKARQSTRDWHEDPDNHQKHLNDMVDYVNDRRHKDPEFRIAQNTRTRERRLLLKRGGLEELWEKSGGICGLCGEPLPEDYKNGKLVHVDHKVSPRTHGGTNDPDNLHLVCATCNLRKGDKLIEELEWVK